ncbi:putative nuclease HARBI1 isoform X2 [Dreissena polymorpha]|uniref:putative nuclease HARBI1 isoform X2 n=1 Tax=Dreissena polymorpha TaxID=45954 RepID=UPI0022655CBA|nr:putative nuclease HARBI1 isoform X2 [Dreissena polymorpha]
MAAIAVLPFGKPKEFRLSHHLDELTSEEFIARYRFSKNGVSFLENLLKDDLQQQTNRNHALTSIQQILITLRFFGTGAFYSVIGDTLGFHKCTVSRVVENVTDAIIKHLHEFVVWPSPAEKERVKQGFYAVAGFPNVIGCIDGKHIRIQAPHDDEASYVNWKGFHSINVQAVCDHQGKFTSVNASWPGSCHDSHIFRTSCLCAKLEREHKNFADGVLLGDSGYQCIVYMMTPFLATDLRLD